MKVSIWTRYILVICVFFLAKESIAANFEYSNIYSIQGNSVKYSFQDKKTYIDAEKKHHRFLGEEDVADISSFEISHALDGNTYHAGYSHSEQEQHAVLGLSIGDVTVSAITGSAESFMHEAGSFNGTNRFAFHGGNDIGFNFSGAAIDAELISGIHAQMGFSKLKSDFMDLESRSVRYFEMSSQNTMYGRFSVIDRGNTQAAKVFEAGFNYKNASVMLQGMKSSEAKHILRAGIKSHFDSSTQFGLDVIQARDPLHFDETRYTAMLSVDRLIGVKPNLYFGANSDVLFIPRRKKQKSLTRPILAGTGAIASAAIASSGDENQDKQKRMSNEAAAAFAVLNSVNPISVSQNKEYGGWICRNQDNTYAATNPVRGNEDSLTLTNPEKLNRNGVKVTASYHTHAAYDPRYENERFSSTDIQSDRRFNVGGYLATPGGKFKYHFDGKVQLIGEIAH